MSGTHDSPEWRIRDWFQRLAMEMGGLRGEIEPRLLLEIGGAIADVVHLIDYAAAYDASLDPEEVRHVVSIEMDRRYLDAVKGCFTLDTQPRERGQQPLFGPGPDAGRR